MTDTGGPVIKMYAIFARETLQKMKGIEGKLAAQAGHAYLHAYWDAEDRLIYGNSWTDITEYGYTCLFYRNGNDARKISLVVDTVQQLEHLYEKYRPFIGATFVEDCAYTVFTENTVTAVGLGPVRDDWFATQPKTFGELKSLETLRHEL